MAEIDWAEYRPLISECLGTDALEPLLERSTLQSLSRGEELQRDLDPVDSLYMVLEGELGLSVVTAGHTIQLGAIQRGNWVGELAYYSRCGTACSTVTATTDCRLLCLDFDGYTALMKSQVEVACHLSHVLVTMLMRRLRVTVNDPVLDPEGNLLLLGDISVPVDEQMHHHFGVLDFFKGLLGIR